MGAESQVGATKDMAARILSVDYSTLDRETIEYAKLLLLDQLGCQLIGSTLPWMTSIFRYMTSFGGNAEARVVNHGNKLATHDAAFLNAVFGQGHEWDDFSTRGMGAGHAGAGTWPAALAMGERLRASGRNILVAGIAGCECMSRLGKTVRPSSDRRGHHEHGILSPLGAAAVSGRLLHLSEHQMVMALSVAASHSAGLNEFGKTGGR
jgi:2-methylcitrate dehydratase PrpD